jgi:DMSO/TMAO reductase YedYZ molybdopterin-dependent catalytic subunit
MGAPVRLRIPTKLGFKSAKNVQAISVTNTYPGGWTFWCKTGRNGAAAKRFVKCLLHMDCRVASNHTTKALQTRGFLSRVRW